MKSIPHPVTSNSINMVPLVATLVKPLLDTFITPKLEELNKSASSYFLTYKHDYWKHQFSEYIKDSYKKFSTINTIAFNNQQRQLKDLYIPLTIVNRANKQSFTINDFDENLLPFYEKILITDTAGMGKSTLVKKIFLSIIDQGIGIPIIIELRRLRKDKEIVDEIIEQLNPINKDINKDFILDLIARGDFIFFFDGFDEIALDDRPYVSNNLAEFITKANKNLFIITSRPEPAVVSFGEFIEFTIKPLSVEEAFVLLRKYDENEKIADLLISKVKENIFNLKEFLTNPLLVSLLYTAFEHKQTIPFRKPAFYRQVFDALFELHDLSKGESFNREKIRSCKNLTSEDYHQVLRAMAFICLKKQLKTEYDKDEIIDIIRQAKIFCTGLQFNEDGFLKDITKSAPIFSQDGIYYKWTHKSLMEYFLAQFIFIDSKEHKSKYLQILASNYYQQFDNIIDIYFTIDPKGFRDFLLLNFLNDFIAFMENVKLFPSVSNEDILYRNSLLFLFKIIVVYDQEMEKLDKDADVDTEVLDRVFSYRLNVTMDETDDSGWSFPHSSNSKSDKFGIIYHANKYFYFFNFLQSKNYIDIFNSISFNQEIELSVNVDVVENMGILINSDEDNITNQPVNYKEFNNLITRSFDHLRMLDIKKVKKFLIKIKKEQAEESKLFLE